MALQVPCRVFVTFLSSDRLSGSYKSNPFVFKRKFDDPCVIQTQLAANVAPLPHSTLELREVVNETENLSTLQRAWRRLFGEESGEPDLEAQHPHIQVRPQQNLPQLPPESVNLQGTEACYINKAWMSFNGKPLSSIPLEGTTLKQATADYFMFQKVCGCVSTGDFLFCFSSLTFYNINLFRIFKPNYN